MIDTAKVSDKISKALPYETAKFMMHKKFRYFEFVIMKNRHKSTLKHPQNAVSY